MISKKIALVALGAFAHLMLASQPNGDQSQVSESYDRATFGLTDNDRIWLERTRLFEFDNNVNLVEVEEKLAALEKTEKDPRVLLDAKCQIITKPVHRAREYVDSVNSISVSPSLQHAKEDYTNAAWLEIEGWIDLSDLHADKKIRGANRMHAASELIAKANAELAQLGL